MQLPQYPRYDDYVDSGFDWIKNVPGHWTVSKLGSCLSPVSKKNHGDKPLLSITREAGVIERDVEDQDSNHNFIPDDLSNYKLVREGQFAMNKMKAWQGSYGVSEHTGIVSPAYYVFDFAKSFDPRFFNIAIRSKLYVSYFGSASDGVRIGQWDLNKTRMKAIPFLVPPLEEQQAIARFLDDKTDKMDQAVKIKEGQIALLRERKQIIIQEVVTKGLDPDAPMKDSGIDWIGQIPAHWTVDTLGSLLFPVSEKNHPEKTLLSVTREQGVIVRDVEDQESNHNFIPDDLSGYKLVRAGQFAMNKMKAWQGSYGISEHTGIVSPAYFVFSLLKDFDGAFFNTAIRSKLYVTFFGQASDGVRIGQWDLNKTRMKAIPFIYPSVEEQKEIVKHIEFEMAKIDGAIELKERQIEALKEYKATLINAAVTGKIKVI
ncbi:restriction endonuclease subunit S [Sulfitobacter aestuarii]|uniref:Restriction endonuclease subunit S n=1 Tax=Sulfitobacter aestuarii TaxID=2161676 RepID=A0ABW5U9M6_9RHOB